MPFLRPPADVQDFAEVPAHTEDLKRKYEEEVIGAFIDHVDVNPANNGAIQLSKNYYDPRGARAPTIRYPSPGTLFPVQSSAGIRRIPTRRRPI
jgi:hypothetical protein